MSQLVPSGPAAAPTRTAPVAAGDDPLDQLSPLLPVARGDLESIRLLATGKALPPPYRDDPGSCLAAAFAAREYGVGVWRVLNSTHYINGKLELKASALRGFIFERHGDDALVIEVDDELTVARAVCRRRGWAPGRTVTVAYAYAEAVAAGLPDRNPNWRTQRRAMLVARVTSRAAGELFPDVTYGVAAEGDHEAHTAAALAAPADTPPVEAVVDDAAPAAAPAAEAVMQEHLSTMREHIETAKAERAALAAAPVVDPVERARELLELVRGATTLDELKAVNDTAAGEELLEQRVDRLALRRHIANRHAELSKAADAEAQAELEAQRYGR